MSAKQQVKVYKACTELQEKSGKGKIDGSKLARAEASIDEATSDFYSFAKENLDCLKNSIIKARKSKDISKKELLSDISDPLFQLKSSSSLFKYDLVGILAGIMFDFIQKIDYLDDRALDIISAHHTTLNAIISNNMTGAGGEQGQQLKKELMNVCEKYFKNK